MTPTFKEHVAMAVAVAILLWKDATPMTMFPPADELVKIELGRVLSHPMLFHDLPWLRGRIAPLSQDLVKEPWDVDPPALIDAYMATLENPEELELVGNVLLDVSFMDPAFDMIRRHGKRPTATSASIASTVRGVVTSIGLSQDSADRVTEGVESRYHTIYSQLYPHHAS